MLWANQEKLDAACMAMAELAASLTEAGDDGKKVIMPQAKFDQRKWETLLCGLLSATSDYPNAVMPEGTHFVRQFGLEDMKSFP